MSCRQIVSQSTFRFQWPIRKRVWNFEPYLDVFLLLLPNQVQRNQLLEHQDFSVLALWPQQVLPFSDFRTVWCHIVSFKLCYFMICMTLGSKIRSKNGEIFIFSYSVAQKATEAITKDFFTCQFLILDAPVQWNGTPQK